MARTTGRSGFKLRSGNSTPFKELGAKPMAPPKPPKPGSSKEELMEIAGEFVPSVESIESIEDIERYYGTEYGASGDSASGMVGEKKDDDVDEPENPLDDDGEVGDAPQPTVVST